MKFSISQERKDKMYMNLTKPYVVVLVMSFAPLLNYYDRNFSYFFGLGIALTILWSSGKDWSLFGFAKRISMKTVLQALVLTVMIMFISTAFDLLVEHYFGEPNLSSLEHIKHNTISYIVMMIIVWVFAAFGEELLFRGYYLKWLAAFLGNSNKAWITSVIIVSFYFGISHYYQGMSGIISIIFIALICSAIFYKNRDNLGLLVLMHGFHDSVGVTFLYLDKENPMVEWLQYFL